MRRGVYCACAVLTALLFSGITADAQPPTKSFRIGWLGSDDVAPKADSATKDFDQGLRDLRYVDGQNITVVYRAAEGKLEKLTELSTDLVKQRVDVIVTSGVPAAFAAKRATSSIPIIVTEFGLDPVKARLVDTLNRPEANVTGLATISEELWPKRLGLLKEIVPTVVRLVVFWNPTNPGNSSCIQEIGVAAPAMGMRMMPIEVSDAKLLDAAFGKIAAEPPDAIAICWDNVSLRLRSRSATSG